MSTAKASLKRAEKKAVRKPEAKSPAPETPASKWPMVERVVDPAAPYFGLSKEEFERLAFWRKVPRCPELDQAGDWLLANLDRIRAESIEDEDGSQRTKIIEYDEMLRREKPVERDGEPL